MYILAELLWNLHWATTYTTKGAIETTLHGTVLQKRYLATLIFAFQYGCDDTNVFPNWLNGALVESVVTTSHDWTLLLRNSPLQLDAWCVQKQSGQSNGVWVWIGRELEDSDDEMEIAE